MTGQIISLLIGAVIVYFAVRALLKSFKDAANGKCTGCSGNCSTCTFDTTLKGRNS